MSFNYFYETFLYKVISAVSRHHLVKPRVINVVHKTFAIFHLLVDNIFFGGIKCGPPIVRCYVMVLCAHIA